MDKDDVNELYENIKQIVDNTFGKNTEFLMIVPSSQQVATNIDPQNVCPLLANILSSMLDGNAHVVEHVSEDGDDETPKHAGIN